MEGNIDQQRLSLISLAGVGIFLAQVSFCGRWSPGVGFDPPFSLEFWNDFFFFALKVCGMVKWSQGEE